jgi:hypothetical protein
MVSALGLEVIKYPSGKFGFVGRVPTDLAWQMSDGSIVPEQIAADIMGACIRSYAMKTHGVSTRVFASREDAIKFAADRGYKAAESRVQS